MNNNDLTQSAITLSLPSTHPLLKHYRYSLGWMDEHRRDRMHRIYSGKCIYIDINSEIVLGTFTIGIYLHRIEISGTRPSRPCPGFAPRSTYPSYKG